MSPTTIRTQHTLTGRMRNLANFSKPAVDISLRTEGGAAAWVNTYTSRDTIRGSVAIVAPSDTRFDNVDISFVGSTKTFVDKVASVSAVTGRTEAFHQFLKLTQPIEEEAYPQPRVAEAGRTYQFPFTFVVPEHMIISSCRHKTRNHLVKDAHLRLPPSMGDPELSGTGSSLLDDMAPEMARISYGIRVLVTRTRERDGKVLNLVEKTKKVRIVPAFEEQPPADIDGCDDEYALRVEKNIRKGVFKSKSGRLVMEAAQPRSLRLRHPKSTDTTPTSTIATVMLRFDPADATSTPPKLNRLVNRLKVVTFYATSPRSGLPSKSSIIYDVSQGVHVDSLALSSRCMASAQWERHEPYTNWSDLSFRRGSAASITACPEPSDAHVPGNPFYTAQLLVPVELPSNKSFVPTFHSCLVSRLYILDMQLGIQSSSNSAGVGTTMTLKAPIQVSADGNDHSSLSSPTDSGWMLEEEEEEDDPLLPRSIAPPRDEYLRTSAIGHQARPTPEASSAPPEYSYFAPRGGFVPVSA